MARRDSISKRPATQPTRLLQRVLISDFLTSPEIVRTTTTTIFATTTIAAMKSTSTPVLEPLTFLQPTPTRMDVTTDDVRTELRPQTTSTVSISLSTTTTTTTSAGLSGTTTVIINAGNDSAFTSLSFRGVDSEDAGAWLRHFEKHTAYRGNSDADELPLLAMLLRDTAGDWYDSLNDDIRTDWTTLKDAFKRRFEDTDVIRWRRGNELYKRVQEPSETVDDYTTAIRKLANSLGIVGEQERYAVQRNLRPEFLADVIRAQATTLHDVVKAARIAETARMISTMSTTSPDDVLLDKPLDDFITARQTAEENHKQLKHITTQLTGKTTTSDDVNTSHASSPGQHMAMTWPQRYITDADADVYQRI